MGKTYRIKIHLAESRNADSTDPCVFDILIDGQLPEEFKNLEIFAAVAPDTAYVLECKYLALDNMLDIKTQKVSKRPKISALLVEELHDCGNPTTTNSPTAGPTSIQGNDPTGSTASPSSAPTPIPTKSPNNAVSEPQPASGPTNNPSPSPADNPVTSPDCGTPKLVHAINSGSAEGYTTVDGIKSDADRDYNGGRDWVGDKEVDNTEDDTLYQTERHGDFTYSLAVTAGKTYRIKFHLAEAQASYYVVGERVFNILVEGALAFNNVDIYAEAGKKVALVLEYTYLAQDDTLDIEV